MVLPTVVEENQPIKILIVDDKPDMRKAFANLLYFEEDLIIIGLAEDGQDAIDKVLKLNPDIVLMDIEMPVMDGITATFKLRSKLPVTQIIAMSTEMGYKTRALEAGAVAFLVKPFSSEEVSNIIRKAYIS